MNRLSKKLLESFDTLDSYTKLEEDVHGIKDIRSMFKACSLKDIKEVYDKGSRTYTFSGLYTVKVNKHYKNIIFESYDLPISFIVYVIKDGEQESTRVRGYQVAIVGFDRSMQITNEFSVYADDFMNVQAKIKDAIDSYVDYVSACIERVINENIKDIDDSKAGTIKNGLYTNMAVSIFIAYVRDFIQDKKYAPTNVIARLEDNPDFTDHAYNEAEEIDEGRGR